MLQRLTSVFLQVTFSWCWGRQMNDEKQKRNRALRKLDIKSYLDVMILVIFEPFKARTSVSLNTLFWLIPILEHLL